MRRTHYHLLALLAAALLLCGCNTLRITGSGNMVTLYEDITGFQKLDASHGFQVTIEQGEAFSVVVHADDNLVQYLEVERQGTTLRLGLKPGRGYFLLRTTLRAEVTMPELYGIELSGDSEASVSGFATTASFGGNLSGDSLLQGDISCGDARLEISGASTVSLTGSADRLTMELSGDSEAELAEFVAGSAGLEVSGSSRATVNVTGRLDAEVSGDSTVYYTGNPTLGTINSSGGSEIRPKP